MVQQITLVIQEYHMRYVPRTSFRRASVGHHRMVMRMRISLRSHSVTSAYSIIFAIFQAPPASIAEIAMSRITGSLAAIVGPSCCSRWNILCLKTYIAKFPGYFPPQIKQRSSYKHGSKSEQLLCRISRNAVINKKHATMINA
jgi:hypothetical protein